MIHQAEIQLARPISSPGVVGPLVHRSSSALCRSCFQSCRVASHPLHKVIGEPGGGGGLVAEVPTMGQIILVYMGYFLVCYVWERTWWPIQSPIKGRKKKVKGLEERERDQIKFIRLEQWQVVRFRKARGRQDVP